MYLHCLIQNIYLATVNMYYLILLINTIHIYNEDYKYNVEKHCVHLLDLYNILQAEENCLKHLYTTILLNRNFCVSK